MAEWLKKAIFYEVYPQSFKDSNGDGIGDIPGLMEKLDYIRELGMNAIWINPCFDSPFYDAGYDVADYYRVAPRYGTNEDLKRLFEKAHSYGMHVLLDLGAGAYGSDASLVPGIHEGGKKTSILTGMCGRTVPINGWKMSGGL